MPLQRRLQSTSDAFFFGGGPFGTIENTPVLKRPSVDITRADLAATSRAARPLHGFGDDRSRLVADRQ